MMTLRTPRSRLTVKVKLRKCAICRTSFEKRSMGHTACSPACAVQVAIAKSIKADKAKDAARRENIKTRSDYIKEAQVAFNAYIRARDADKPCISSGVMPTQGTMGGAFDAGHYRSIGSAPHLRFNEFNVHGQSKHDNRYLAGNAVDYRIGLIKRIGLPLVESLECDDLPAKWSIDDLKAIKATYRAKLRDLLKAQK